MPLPVAIRLNAVIVAVTDEVPRILTVEAGRDGTMPCPDERLYALPYGPLDTDHDRTLEIGLRRWVRERTGLELGYVEQLYTFGDLHREPAEPARILSVTYLALIREESVSRGSEAWWQDWYQLFPWEDRRSGPPEVTEELIVPWLQQWADRAQDATARQQRRDRISMTFGLGGSPWDGERVLERYELLYEAGLVEEALRDRATLGQSSDTGPDGIVPSRSLAFDHRRIAATALGRIRGKLRYRPVVFELLPETFTLFQLQRVVEALAGVRLHKQNFRRLVDRGGLVEGTGRFETRTGGRPAELFRFRREVLRERPAPGVGLPGLGNREQATGNR